MASSGAIVPDRFTVSRPDVFDRLDELQARIDGAASLVLFLDFDGTLAPIVSRPALAELPSSARQALNKLAALAGTTIAIVSGRALGDIVRRVGISGVIYAGNHGLEIAGEGLLFEHPRAVELMPAVNKISAAIEARSSALEGVEVEYKVLTTSVHYRQASSRARFELEGLISGLVPPDDPNIEVRAGKMVHEIRPRVAWDKGKAVAWIRDQLGLRHALPIVAGDDMTDESAFTAFKDAITICVNPRRVTAANYGIAGPDQVTAFLEWVLRTWGTGRGTR